MDLIQIVALEIYCPVAGWILLYDPKTPFTSRVEVDNRISAPMSYLTFGNRIAIYAEANQHGNKPIAPTCIY